MKKRYLFYALALLLTVAGCKKEPEATNELPEVPSENFSNAFSVASGRQVRLAEGNLQYQASTKTWRFAEHPWDVCGEANLQASATFDGWIDCFAWGTSGYDNTLPYSPGTTNDEYYHGGDIAGTQYDWGEYNAIKCGNATYDAGTWRSLTASEWNYLLFERSASTVEGVENARWVMVSISDNNGMMLFPDQFEMPEGASLMTASSINEAGDYSYNQLSYSEWEKFAQAGCVFMPAAGFRLMSQNSMVSAGYLGCYWTGSYDVYDPQLAHTATQILFNPYGTQLGHSGLQYPRTVRLAKNLY